MSKLEEFLDQVRECDRIIEQQESMKEEIFKRIDEEIEKQGGI